MKKAELVATLSAKFYKIFMPSKQQTYGNLAWYLVKVYDKVGDALRDMNIAFYVEDEGLPTEAAFWSPSEPKPTAQTGFQQEIMAYIALKIADGAIKAAFPEQMDIANEKAIFKAILEISGNLIEKRLLVDRDIGGEIRYRQL